MTMHSHNATATVTLSSEISKALTYLPIHPAYLHTYLTKEARIIKSKIGPFRNCGVRAKAVSRRFSSVEEEEEE